MGESQMSDFFHDEDEKAGHNSTKPNGHANPWRAIEIIDFADIKARLDWRWLVDGLLMPEQISLFFGEPGSGKTFLALDMALHVAAGARWFGRATTPGLVIYLAAEAGRSIFQRVAAWKLEHPENTNIPFAVIPCALDLCHADVQDIDHLISDIREKAEKAGIPVALVIIDTVSRVLAGGDENSSTDMGGFRRSLDRLRDELHCHATAVHHPGKELSRGARGHSMLKADIDAEIIVTKQDTISRARVDKQRDGPIGETLTFKIRPMIIGYSENGTPVTSCVIRQVEGDDSHDPNISKNGQQRLSPKDKIALDTLKRALSGYGKPATPDIPVLSSTTVVELDSWRQIYLSSTSSEGQPENTRRKALARSQDRLNANEIIRIWGKMVWIT
jgi:hypothetical protein